MKKNLFVINENEKERIINMHKNATKNLYIFENKLLTEKDSNWLKYNYPMDNILVVDNKDMNINFLHQIKKIRDIT